MAVDLTVLYRGPLSSCNYECWYCPFAKRADSQDQLRADREALERFVAWVEARDAPTSVLFTPWGEALVRGWYREAMVRLSRAARVRRVAAQTNLSMSLGWLEECDRRAAALWCTFHSSQTTADRFLRRCAELDRLGVRYSVGCVGLKEDLDAIEDLRRRLDPRVYLWVNAFKREAGYYTPELVERIGAVDPLFRVNTVRYRSRGRRCRAGDSVVSVDGNGDVRRCHFVKDVIGNIYDPAFESRLSRRLCPAETCGCHIGYAHMDDLGLDRVFGDGLLERIPAADLSASDARAAAAAFARNLAEREGSPTAAPARADAGVSGLVQVSISGL